jgi:hypothetical protein
MRDSEHKAEKVTCRECKRFVHDVVGDGYGLGECKEFIAYKAKNPTDSQLRKALTVLGNRGGNSLFWGGPEKDRDCSRFIAMTPDSFPEIPGNSGKFKNSQGGSDMVSGKFKNSPAVV